MSLLIINSSLETLRKFYPHFPSPSTFGSFDMCIPKEKFRDELVAKKERLLKEDPNDPLLALINQELAFLTTTGYEDAENLSEQTPRLLKSHLPFSLLPPDILFKNKVRGRFIMFNSEWSRV